MHVYLGLRGSATETSAADTRRDGCTLEAESRMSQPGAITSAASATTTSAAAAAADIPATSWQVTLSFILSLVCVHHLT